MDAGQLSNETALPEVHQLAPMRALREATSRCHQALERDAAILDGLQSRAALGRLLARWYGFLLPFEALVSANAGSLSAFVATRGRIPQLRADLAHHGIVPEQLPICPRLPAIASLDSMLGAMYVTEGSTLGGRLIATHLERVLGLRDGHGYSFFVGYGERTGSMWKQFSALVNDRRGVDLHIAVETAIATFTCLQGWLAA